MFDLLEHRICDLSGCPLTTRCGLLVVVREIFPVGEVSKGVVLPPCLSEVMRAWLTTG